MNRKAILKQMSNGKNHQPPAQLKARTGVEGFDEITNGGLPSRRTTLLEGGPGSGKTIMALETLVTGARVSRQALDTSAEMVSGRTRLRELRGVDLI